MSVMDLYLEICKERFGLNKTAEPVKPGNNEEPPKKAKKVEPSATKSHVKKRPLSVDCGKIPAKKSKVAVSGKGSNTSQKLTDDGFKIVSVMDLPPDDSDISDAFESDDDTNVQLEPVISRKAAMAGKLSPRPTTKEKTVGNKKSNTSQKLTDDGFKIVSEMDLPPDDSDISDAFESDDDEEEDNGDDNDDTNMQVKPVKSREAVKAKSSVQSRTEEKTVGELTEEKTVGELTEEKTVGELTEEKMVGGDSTKKRKRGPRNKKRNIGDSQTIPKPKKKKDKDKKNRKPKKNNVPALTEEDIEAIKARIQPKIQKAIMEFGLDWARFDTPAEREKREMAKLPQPEQIPNCTTYLKKDHVSGNIITVYDYSKKRGGSKAALTTAKPGGSALSAPKSGAPAAASASADSGMKQAGVVTKKMLAKANKNAKPGEVPLTKEQLELIEMKKKMKAEHLEELRNIKRKMMINVINKSLDPRTKDQKRLAHIEKLGGVVKKPYVNYKVLMENKKKEKQEAEVARENLKNIGMHDLLKKKRRRFRKKDPNEVAGFNSLGGRIRDGVMVIGKKDLAKMNT